jgi:H/ACA ribonucleoprotein complex subunit 3
MKIKKCESCGTYTMKEKCPKCGGKAISPQPPKYSPEDRYGKYRRKFISKANG